MIEWRVPLADVVVPEEEIDAVAEAYRSGWLSIGPRTEELERAFADYTGARHAIALANGTAALHLACLGVGVGPGDEVVVPSLTFVATVNAIAYAGATPVFADIAAVDEPWLATAAAAEAIGERTKAIMAVSYGGHPGETEALAALAGERGIALIEDAAHGLGTRVGGRHLGTIGEAGAFSFFSNKNLAIGEGGMLVTDDDGIAEAARQMRSHGMTTLSWDRHRGDSSGYDVARLGFNYRIDEPRAALATRRLARLDDENRRRAAIDAAYRDALSGLDEIEPIAAGPERAGLSHHLFAALLDEGIDRDAFRTALADAGVQTSVHYPPVHRFSIYAADAPELPLTDAYARRTVTLPIFPHMSGEQRSLVIDAVGNGLPG